MTTLIFFSVICLPQAFALKPEPCNKETRREVTIPRGPNVFGLPEVLDYIVDVPFRSIYHITTDHYHNHMYGIISTTDNRTFSRRLYFDGLAGECIAGSGTGTLVDDNLFRITVDGETHTIFEVYFSTCPERYVISMLCFNPVLPAITCSANRTVIIVRIPEKMDQTGNTVMPIERLLDNFPMKNAADDILNATGLNIGMLNLPLKSVFTFGENSCCNDDPRKDTSSACPANACPGKYTEEYTSGPMDTLGLPVVLNAPWLNICWSKNTGIKLATAMAMVILFYIY